MQVKKRLQINVAFSVITALLIFLVAFTALSRINSANRTAALAGEIIVTTLERLTLRNDYIRNNNERAKEQWFSKQEQLSRLLKSAREGFRDPGDRSAIEKLTRNHESIGRIFSAVVVNRNKHGRGRDAGISREVEDRLLSQLNIRVYEATVLSRKLMDSSREARDAAIRFAGEGVIILVLVLIAAAIFNSLTMSRTIASRIEALRKGAGIIGEGDLDHRIDIAGDDEFAELSKAFNAMTERLGRSYVSLEKEIDERTQAQEALRESLEAFQAIMNATTETMFLLDTSWTFVAANETTARRYGKKAKDIIGLKMDDLLAPELANSRRERFREVMGAKKPLVFEDARAGILFEHSVFPLFDERGNVYRFAVFSRDITERRKAEKFRESSAYHRSLIEASLDPLVTIAADGKIIDVNAATEKATGLARGELIGTDFSDYFTEPDKARAGYEQVFREGSVTDYALEIKCRHGETTPVLYNAAVYRDAAGSVLGVFAAARDITERKKAEEEIRKLNAELEQRVTERTAELESSNLELEAFAYSVSHDLRTPLRSIEGFSLALLEDYADRLDDQGKDYLSRVRNATRRMGHLIDDLLKLSRVTRSDMNREQVDLSRIARRIAADLTKDSPQRDAEFSICGDLAAFCDERLMTVALENIFSNAWKFSEKAPRTVIEFGTILRDHARVFFVKDNGAGFDMTYAGKLFNPFQRLHKTDEFPGTGIGLATVRRIVNRHGGKVWIESEVDRGTTVYFTL